jgi:hypothetical protein
VGKRVVPGTFAAFEFRLRAVSAAGAVAAGTPLVWSAVFPMKAGTDVPAEAFLHLPQAQGFKAAALLPGSMATIRHAQVSAEGRVTLGKESKVEPGPARFTGWEDVLRWDPASALARLRGARPGPFDLDVELQEEVALRDFQAGEPETVEREHLLRHPISAARQTWHVVTGTGPEDAALRERLASWRTAPQKGPLYGLLHYESCRFVLQPLTLFGDEEPLAVQLAEGTYDASTLIKALKFT